jgi:tetratricopeptide (TPR) repeat protein
LAALPFVSHPRRLESLLIYQPLFRTFLSDRLSRELSSAEIGRLHRAAASHFLDDKSMPPAAHHHARLAGDSALLIRTTGPMVEFAFSRGDYPLLRDVINQLSPTTRWEDATLAVYQGRLYEHDRDLINALKWYRRAQELFEQEGPAFWKIGIINDIGGILRKTGKLDEALALYDEALARTATDTPSLQRAGLMANRANVFLQRGWLEQAEEGFSAARDIFELNRNAGGLTRSYQGLAHVAHARKNEEAAFRFYVKALHWLRRSDDMSSLPHVAAFVGERLIMRGKHALAHAIYAATLKLTAINEAPDVLPLLLTNFGFTSAFLPEPDAAGVRALLTAREMKRATGPPYGGTLQNLSLLLIRLGELQRAVDIVREQADLAKRTNNADLANDAAAKLIHLESYFSGVPPPDALAKQTPAGGWNDMAAAQGMMVEGRARLALKRRWPMIHELIADGPSDSITIEGKTFELRNAETILILARGGARIDADDKLPETEHNLILELLWEPDVGTEGTRALPDGQMAAIWWMRTGRYCWVQAFWHERSEIEKDRVGVVALKGSLFSLDQATWNSVDHPDACNCGRPDLHEELRKFADAIVSISASASRKRDITIGRRRYPLVPLHDELFKRGIRHSIVPRIIDDADGLG